MQRRFERAPVRSVDAAIIDRNLQRIETALPGIVALAPQTITANQTIALGVADLVEITLAGNVTLTMSGSQTVPGTSMMLALTQDGTGSRTVTWAGVTWVGGSAPSTSTAAGARDVYLFVSIAGITNVLGVSLGPNLSIGKLAFAGLLDISAAGAGQIKFPATQNASADANTLDDYEEGTWTPVIGGSGGQSGQAYSQQLGVYTKIGRLVIAEFDVILSTLGTVTGNVQVQGLPVVSGSGTTWQSVPIWVGLSTAVTSIPARLLNGDTAATLFKVTAAATSSASAFLQSADLSDTSRFAGRFVYYSA